MFKDEILKNKSNIFDHIFYEFSMYLQTNECKSENQLLINVILISQLTHLRNLSEFFYDKKKYSDDIYCNDIIDDGKNLCITKDQYTKVMDEVSKSISHLTLHRCEYTTTVELFKVKTEMYPIITDFIKRFIEMLPEKVKDRWKTDFKSNYTKTLIDNTKKLFQDKYIHIIKEEVIKIN